jgi:glutamyl-tRNA reductase
LDPTLAVIGVNYRTAPVAVRERFWISEPRRYDALHQLVRSEAIDEVIVLATCNRTEFILWTSDVPSASNSVLRFLAQEYKLKLCEWSHFYRLMDDVALTHVFKVASSLDSMVIGEPGIVGRLKNAWSQAQKAGCTGRFLDSVVQTALAVSQRVRTDTAVCAAAVSVPCASVELAREVLGDLAGREVLLIGAGQMSELAARCLMNAGAANVKVLNRTLVHAEELAGKLKGTAMPMEQLEKHLHETDIVVSSTSCPDWVITHEEMKAVMHARESRPMVIIDVAVPRDIDPRVRDIEGLHLFDIDDLEQVVRRNSGERQAATSAAEKIVHAEVQGFRRRLAAEHVVPTIAALRQRLDELCRQELEELRKEFGPFTADQDQAMAALAAHITQRIAASLARELKELPEHDKQDMLSGALHRVFRLEESEAASAQELTVNTRQ